ncbi:Zinc-type alcohol dehydrogenase-like protein C2E1P3.01 [Tolypocladium ophioglossoides CBS 100239]|uniref:Zinc-type alcohol dehydrogenase-like protein C2E1P3.01 n=1 Tax=Tolypocladium ophioglossoides (strain CBS 100239) TaxID=1163406 RepID=A0A0L0N4H9_TOLOC|nr:Zinc-type alcohol dehydrogenase-like protein C2E1P3.01 [Tolypocladium ophioglossoides CBS 100239]
MKGLVLTPSRREAKVEELPKPTPGPGEVLIHVRAVALNPVDGIYVSSPIAVQDKRVVGTDLAGIVEGASSEFANSADPRTKTGTRVAGFLQGACSVNDRPGAFAEYITAPYDLIWVIPPGLSLEAASTISMCGLTAAQGLFARLGLPSPFHDKPTLPRDDKNKNPVNVLVYGSSTSLGLYAAQLINLSSAASGRKIRLIGAASASKHGFLQQKPYNYDVLVDYRDSDWVDKVKAATDGRGVDYAMDCISEGSTVYKSHETLNSSAKFSIFRGPVGGQYDPSKLTVKPIYGAVWEGLGVKIGYNGTILPENPKARDFATKFFDFLGTETSAGGAQLEPNPVRVMPGGLEKIVPDGFSLLGSGLVVDRVSAQREEDYMRPISAEKLVYNI